MIENKFSESKGSSILFRSDATETRSHFCPPLLKELALLSRLSSSAIKRLAEDLVPPLYRKTTGERVYARLRSLLASQRQARNEEISELLILGVCPNAGLRLLASDPKLKILYAATLPTSKIQIRDEGLPIADSCFDAVVCDGRLDQLCHKSNFAEEISRILRLDGILYVDAPMSAATQQPLVELLSPFVGFEILESGISGGPGMKLACSVHRYFSSRWNNRIFKAAVNLGCRTALWWCSLADTWLVQKLPAMELSATLYFLGRKSYPKVG